MNGRTFIVKIIRKANAMSEYRFITLEKLKSIARSKRLAEETWNSLFEISAMQQIYCEEVEKKEG